MILRMAVALLIPSCLVGSLCFAQDVTMKEPTLYCAINQFSPSLNKPPTPAFKKCASLMDAKDEPTKSLAECKTRALERGRACLVKTAMTKLAVRGKFTEKFDIRSQSTTFTCELDNNGGNNCP